MRNRRRALVCVRPRSRSHPNPTETVGGAVGPVGGAHGFGAREGSAPPCPYKARGIRWGNAVCRSRHLVSSGQLHPPLPSPPRLQISRHRETGDRNGFQLRGHHRGGGKVPHPRSPQQQHDADRRGGVAQEYAEEVARVGVGAVRGRPRARFQVCLRAGHPRRVLQVPLPPHQLPGPRPRPGKPPFFASLTGRGQRGAAAPGLAVLVLRHRRHPVTQPRHRQENQERSTTEREGKIIYLHVIRKGVYLSIPRCSVCRLEKSCFLSLLPPVFCWDLL